MRSYEHIIFDFDGVMCDSLPAAMAVFNELREGAFSALPSVQCQDDMVRAYGGSLRTCLSEWLAPDEHRRFFDAHSAAMADRAGELRLFDGIPELMEAMPPKSMSIVTSAYSEAVEAIINRTASTSLFQRAVHRVAGRELRQPKSTKIATIAGELQIPVDECVYVGDLESDILYCREVPIDVIAVSYGYHPAWHLAQCEPTFLVHSVAELQRLLRQLLPKNAAAREALRS